MSKNTSKGRLTHVYEKYDVTTLDDLFSCMVSTLEDSFVQVGAVPGKDFTFLDLYKLAAPFVLNMYKTNGNVTITCGWPDYERIMKEEDREYDTRMREELRKNDEKN